MNDTLSARERVLRFFGKQEIDRIPIFSGYGNVTVHGLEKYGWKFADIHVDAQKMAAMAASTYKLFGFECAVVPFDMGVEAEALGAGVNFYTHRDDVVYPTITTKVSEKVEDLDLKVPSDLAGAGRIPLVAEAIRLLKKDVGDQVVVGSWVLGPYTLAGQLVDIGDLAKMASKKKDLVNGILDTLADALINIVKIYRDAGADYITVREMGAGPDILSPRMFKALIQPHLEKVFAALDSPKILHICGDTNTIVEAMAACGADAISVDQKNNVAESRKKLGAEVCILGNLDPYGILVVGKPEDVENDVKNSISSGVNALWPGCDIFPTAPRENMEALMAAVEKYGRLGSCSG
jgi:[methyl-Co(III) methanol-specific corrinoid protein]:coenzyme M methyltransferase